MAWRRGPEKHIEGAAWEAAVTGCPMLARLRPGEAERVRHLADEFLARKSLEGAGGLQIDPSMAATIAAQACVPLIGLDLQWYRGWRSVIVYPADFVARHEYVDEAGVVHESARALAGESWDRGPIVLSWEGIDATGSGREWGNLIVHECAHKLDALGGAANGVPPLARGADRARWAEVMSDAFERLRAEAEELDPDDILAQAAEEPAEFFAVVSEWLHTEPESLREELPAVYEVLVGFYRRDPCPSAM